MACGTGAEPRVIVDAAATPTVRAAVPGGEKLGSAPRTPAAAPDPTPTEAPPAPSPVAPVAEPPTPTAAPAGISTPASGRWIDVDVTDFIVRLMDGATVVREIGPVGVGARIDTGDYLSTQTGLFYVNSKVADLVYDEPFDTYISHWVGFDAEKDNGFHSFLKDATGSVVDASTGRISNGCIRTGEPEAIFAFAEIGMPVRVHW
jgi:hypothetical protein